MQFAYLFWMFMKTIYSKKLEGYIRTLFSHIKYYTINRKQIYGIPTNCYDGKLKKFSLINYFAYQRDNVHCRLKQYLK